MGPRCVQGRLELNAPIPWARPDAAPALCTSSRASANSDPSPSPRSHPGHPFLLIGRSMTDTRARPETRGRTPLRDVVLDAGAACVAIGWAGSRSWRPVSSRRSRPASWDRSIYGNSSASIGGGTGQLFQQLVSAYPGSAARAPCSLTRVVSASRRWRAHGGAAAARHLSRPLALASRGDASALGRRLLPLAMFAASALTLSHRVDAIAPLRGRCAGCAGCRPLSSSRKRLPAASQ
jgi:hypothetical protein